MPQAARRSISLLMPAFNEAPGIQHILQQLHAKLAKLPYDFQIILVDDGSTDDTVERARACSETFPLTIIRLSRNFGKETALLAGLDHVNTDATVILDADLQHPLSLIPEFISHWENGYKSVYGVKKNRAHEPRLNAVLGRLFYWLINRGGGVRIEPNALDFRLLDKSVVRALCSIRERVRFTKGLYAWVGFSSIGIPFEPSARQSGSSRFSRRKLSKLAWDGLTSFSDFPLRLSVMVGGSLSVASIVYGGYIALRTLLFGADVPGWATLTVAMLLLSGTQLIFLGIIGIYIRNILEESKQRPDYIVAELLSVNGEHDSGQPTAPREDAVENLTTLPAA